MDPPPIFIFVLIYFSSCHAIEITKDTILDIKVKEGDTYDLNCVADKTYTHCSWQHLGTKEKCTFNNNLNHDVCNINSNSWIVENRIIGYKHVDNECTLRISQAQLEDHSQWKCYVYYYTDEEASATINVTVFWPTVPEFRTKPHRVFQEGMEEKIECQGTGGFPKPTIHAFVSPNPYLEYSEQDIALNSISEGQDYDEEKSQQVYTRLFSYVPNHLHQNYYLRCVTLQSYDGKDIYPMREVKVPLEVHFSPKLLIDSTVFKVTLGMDTIITIPISANPMPTEDQINWHIGSWDKGSQDGRFETLPTKRFLENQTIEIQLLLRNVQESYLETNFELIIANDVGNEVFNIILEGPEPEQSTELPGTGTGISPVLMAVITGIILLLVIGIVVGIFICKRNGLVCFDNASNVELQNQNPGTDLRTEMLTTGSGISKDEVDFFDQSGKDVEANTSIIKMKNGENRGKKSPNQRASYRAATTRTSELIPPWPEDSKEPLKSSYDDDELL